MTKSGNGKVGRADRNDVERPHSLDLPQVEQYCELDEFDKICPEFRDEFDEFVVKPPKRTCGDAPRGD